MGEEGVFPLSCLALSQQASPQLIVGSEEKKRKTNKNNLTNYEAYASLHHLPKHLLELQTQLLRDEVLRMCYP